MRRGPAAAFLVCLVAAIPGWAEQYANLSGQVLDPSEAGVPGAAISLVNEDSGFRRTAESSADGAFTISTLQPGLYRLLVRKAGFRTVIRFGIKLETASSARLNVTLPVGSMQDSITVLGTPGLMARDDTAVTTQITRDEIERLPINGRGPLGLAELSPGTVATPATRGESGQFTANGQRPNANYFTVDGVSANTGVSGGGLAAQTQGGALPGMSAFGSIDALISMEAVDEFAIRTSTSSSDYGRLPGAAISLTSRTGSAELHGSTLYRFRHEDLAANDWFANREGTPRAPLRLHRFAQTLGGPIRSNRTFFFASYEGMRLRQPYAWRTPVPSIAGRANAADWLQPILNLFPVPNGGELSANLAEFTGRNRRPAKLDAGSLRLDHALTSRLNLFARFQDAPSTSQSGSTAINRLDMRTIAFTFGADVHPTPRLALEARLNWSSATAASAWSLQGAAPCALNTVVAALLRNPGACDDFVRFTISGVGQIASGSEGTRSQSQYQAVASATLVRTKHTLRFGNDFRRLAPRRRDDLGTLNVLAETLDGLVSPNSLWRAQASAVRASIVVRELSAWIHDTWQITPRLTLSSGLRWEYSPPPTPVSANFLDVPTNTVLTLHQPLWQQSYRNFAPRLGVAWRPAGDRMVVRAAAGLYYDSSLAVATDSINGGPMSLGALGSSMAAPFSSILTYGFLPTLKLPRTAQWSVFIDTALTPQNTLSIGYAGSAARDLLRREIGGAGSTQTAYFALATNHGAADYSALQVQYRRNLAKRVQGLASYSWSHSLDNSSSDSLLEWTGKGSTTTRDHASSDFDLRHLFSAGFGIELGRGWGLDAVVHARTGFPISVAQSEQYLGIPLANAFRPDLVAGQPLWIAGETGRRLNPAAFAATKATVQGTLGRNAIPGFGMSEVNLALRRDFRFGDRWRLEARLQAFNALNQVNFADPVPYLDSPLFGQPTSMLNLMLGSGSPASGLAPVFQNGGPRSLQLSLRLRF